MSSFSLNDIKKELSNLDSKEILDICVRVAKYKKENKELISYLLFEAGNEAEFIINVQKEIDEAFSGINTSSVFLAKKTVRKALKIAQKNIKYSGIKQTEVELLLHFCKTYKATGIKYKKAPLLLNIFNRQIDKIKKILPTLHEDLQYDFQKELDELE